MVISTQAREIGRQENGRVGEGGEIEGRGRVRQRGRDAVTLLSY